MHYNAFPLLISLALCAVQFAPTYAAIAPTTSCPTADEFFRAIIHGNLPIVKAYLAAGGNPNIKQTVGYEHSALIWAAGTGHFAIVKELLGCPNLNVMQTNAMGLNAADAAFQSGSKSVDSSYTEILKLLAERGCTPTTLEIDLSAAEKN